MKRNIYLVSLGCPKNLVDSEVMTGLLMQENYQVTNTVENADVLLVNTCGFIQSAVEEAIDTILELLEVKKEQQDKQKVVVTGCLVQRYGKDLQRELPEVDLFVGTEGVAEIVSALDGLFQRNDPQRIITPSKPFLMNSSMPRVLSAPAHRTYLKVTEGCINRCAYCKIPSIRGNQRSRTIDDLVCEAQKLEAGGVQEIILVAQDLTTYGTDLKYGKKGLLRLLDGLIKGCSIPWIRLLYLYPSRVTRELLQYVKKENRIVSYLDIPLQHISTKVLRLMNRPYTKESIEELLAMIRGEIPQIALRTTFMVGFPGEKEEDVDQIAAFMERYQLDHVGIFSYSNEEGCPAEKLPDQVDEHIKEERRKRLLEIQAKIAQAKNQQYIGQKIRVLVDGLSRETDLLLEGRAAFQAPEIDGCILINEGSASPGEFVDVQISEAHTYDLVGGIIG